mgnify:CR=1 FL=1
MDANMLGMGLEMIDTSLLERQLVCIVVEYTIASLHIPDGYCTRVINSLLYAATNASMPFPTPWLAMHPYMVEPQKIVGMMSIVILGEIAMSDLVIRTHKQARATLKRLGRRSDHIWLNLKQKSTSCS